MKKCSALSLTKLRFVMHFTKCMTSISVIVISVISFIQGKLTAVSHIDKNSIIFNIVANMSSYWNVYGRTITVFNMDLLDDLSDLSYLSAVEILSINSEQIYGNVTVCDEELNNDNTVILLFLKEFEVEEKLLSYYRWPHYKRATLVVLFILDKTVENDNFLQNIKQLFSEFGSRGIITVVIIVWSQIYNLPNWFTFNYYEKVLFNDTGKFDFRKLYQRNTANLQGFQIKSCLLHHQPFIEFSENSTKITGPDMRAFQTFINFFNISEGIVRTQSVDTSTYMASLTYAKNNACDAIFTRSANFILPGMAKLQYPIRLEHYSILVPKSGKVVGLTNLLMPFQIYVWYAVLISFIVICAFWFILTLIKLPSTSDYDYIPYLDLIKIQINMSSNIEQQRLLLSSKIFVIFSIFYACFLIYAYQSVLYGFLVQPYIEKNMETLEDITKSGLKIFVNRGPKGRSTFVDSTLSQVHVVPVINANNFGSLMQKHRNSKEYGYVCRESWALSYMRKSKRNKDLNLHMVKEWLSTGDYTYKVSCRFTLALRLQQLFRRFEEYGLMSFWSREYILHGAAQKKLKSENPTILEIDDILGPIAFWSFGCIISIIVFCFEYFSETSF